MTGKQRAYLRGLANGLDTIFQIGKGGISEEMIRQISAALEARELIKLRVLESAGYTAAEASRLLGQRTGAQGVATVGSRFVLYRPSQKKPKIELPKA